MTPQSQHDTSRSDDADLDRTLSALVDGVLGDHERAALESRLYEDQAARHRYLEFMRFEFMIASRLGAMGASKEHAPPSQPPGWRRFMGAAAAAAVIIALAVRGGMSLRPAASPAPAKVTAAQAAVWGGDWQPQIGASLPAGPLRLEKGTAQVTFSSGAVVAIHGPATVELLNGNRLFLRSGRVTPFVPPAAKGFTVVSPSGEVVDFGTEFSVGVDDNGKTDVFVINGEVAVTRGHDSDGLPLHLTQGFASRLAVPDPQPEVTLSPLVVDHFDSPEGPLLRRDFDAEESSVVNEGRLWMPIDGRPHRRVPIARTVLENDFSPIVGRRSVISFKVGLPHLGSAFVGRWVGLVIDDGEGEPQEPHEPGVAIAVLASPLWEAGVMLDGKAYEPMQKFFPRSEDRVGPYQAVVTIDDSPSTHEKRGTGTVTVMINGLEVVSEHPIRIPPRPRFALETYVRRETGGNGYAYVDDFSVSVESGAPTR